MKLVIFSALFGAWLGGLVVALFDSFWRGAIIGAILGVICVIRELDSGNPIVWAQSQRRGATFAIVAVAILLIVTASIVT